MAARRKRKYTKFAETKAIQGRKLMEADRNPMTVAEVAQMFGVSPATVYKRCGCPREIKKLRLTKNPRHAGRTSKPISARNARRHRKSDSAA